MSTDKPVRILVAKPGLDGHDVGARAVATAFRDAGMEVIYTGLHQTPEQIVQAAVQEDITLIGLSILSGAHIPICRKLMELLKAEGIDDAVVFIGGVIPHRDRDELKKIGVAAVFDQNSNFKEMVEFVKKNVK